MRENWQYIFLKKKNTFSCFPFPFWEQSVWCLLNSWQLKLRLCSGMGKFKWKELLSVMFVMLQMPLKIWSFWLYLRSYWQVREGVSCSSRETLNFLQRTTEWHSEINLCVFGKYLVVEAYCHSGRVGVVAGEPYASLHGTCWCSSVSYSLLHFGLSNSPFCERLALTRCLAIGQWLEFFLN